MTDWLNFFPSIRTVQCPTYFVKWNLYLQVFYFIFLFWLSAFLYRLRGTTVGANNRMDLLSLVTSGVNDSEINDPDEDILGVVEGWQDDESHNPDVPAVSHRRGMMPFVFVPFHEVHVSSAFPLEFRSIKSSPNSFPQWMHHMHISYWWLILITFCIQQLNKNNQDAWLE